MPHSMLDIQIPQTSSETMDTVDRRPERSRRRKKLLAIERSLDQLETPQLSLPQLKACNIRQESMCLEGQPRPLFFIPYQARVLPPELDTIDPYPEFDRDDDDDEHDLHDNAGWLARHLRNYFEHCILSEDETPGSRYADFGNFGFGLLLDTQSPRRWQVEAAWDMPLYKPHMKVMMASGITGDDRIFRGELLAIIDVIRTRLRTSTLRPHTIAPVLLFSAVGMHHLRAIEAFFDGEELVVRTTKLYDMGKEDKGLITLLARWWLGHASDRPTAVD